MKYRAILFSFFSLFQLQIASADTHHVVPLPTTYQLPSIFVALPEEEGDRSVVYLLRNVLMNDLALSGRLQLAKKKEEADYAVQIKEEQGRIEVEVVYLKQKKVIRLKSKTLSFYPTTDKALIHLLSEQIVYSLTRHRGIASTRILFSLQTSSTSERHTHSNKSEIWKCDYDGGNAKQVTCEESYCITPAVFPGNGKRKCFVYVNYKHGQPKIYSSYLDQKRGTPFISLRGNQLLPTISSNGSMIAFISDAGGQADLFVQLLDRNRHPLNKPLQLFSYPFSVQSSPTFDPKGKKIAFVSDKDGTPRIYTLPLPKPLQGEKRRLTCISRKHRHNTSPSWSPDGTKLAYSAMIDGIRQIMIYDFTSEKEIQLTHGRWNKENPSWAPDSFHLVYNTIGPFHAELFIIDLNRKDPFQITRGAGKKHYPVWMHD